MFMKSPVMKAITTAVALSFTLTAGCGGGSDGSQDKVSSSGDGLLMSTENPAQPFIAMSGEGNVYGYYVDPDTEAPTRFSAITPAGETFDVVIDRQTGRVDHWINQGSMVLFRNYRDDLGLVDVSVINPDGQTWVFRDNHFKDPSPSGEDEGEEIILIPVAKSFQSRDIKTLRSSEGVYVAINAFSVIISSAICGAGAITVGGGLLIAESATAPLAVPVTVPFIAETGVALAVSCGAAAASFVAMTPIANTDIVPIIGAAPEDVEQGVNANNINEWVGGSVGTVNLLECLGTFITKKVGTLANCLPVATDTIGFIGSQTFRRLRGSFSAAVAVMEDDADARGVYCCDGPDQIKLYEQGEWRAIALTPDSFVDYAFHFSEEPALSITDFSPSSKEALIGKHRYQSSGDHGMRTYAILDSDNPSISRSDYSSVRVYSELEAFCCAAEGEVLSDGVSFKTGSTITIGLNVEGGRQPYTFNFDLDANQELNITSDSILGITTKYDEPGTYDVFYKVTDADEVTVTSSVLTLAVADKEEPGTTTCRGGVNVMNITNNGQTISDPTQQELANADVYVSGDKDTLFIHWEGEDATYLYVWGYDTPSSSRYSYAISGELDGMGGRHDFGQPVTYGDYELPNTNVNGANPSPPLTDAEHNWYHIEVAWSATGGVYKRSSMRFQFCK